VRWSLFLSVFLFLFLCITGTASDVTVYWTFATNNVDGTPITDLAGAKVYYGTASSNYTHVVDAGMGGAEGPGDNGSFTVTGLVFGVRYYLNGTAYNTCGLESDFCNEVSKVAGAPGKPVRLRIFGVRPIITTDTTP